MLLIIIDGAIYQGVDMVAEYLEIDFEDARFRVLEAAEKDSSWGSWVILKGVAAKTPDSIQSAVNVTAQYAKHHLGLGHKDCTTEILEAQEIIIRARRNQVAYCAQISAINDTILKSTETIDAMRETG